MNKVKIFTGVSLFLFFVTVTSLLTAAFVTQSNQQIAKNNGMIVGLNGVTEGGAVADGTAQLSFLTLEEVVKHKEISDCWMIISGAVYNFTPFLAAHPGGAASMAPFCGKDGTVGFATKDKNPAGKHSSLADSMLNQYFVGRLGAQLASAEPTPATGPGTPTPTPKSTALLFVTPTRIPTLAAAAAAAASSNLSLTASEVGRHSSLSDCWLIISGRVYNVTAYIAQHPGGANAISRHCGTDSTTAFATKDANSPHSSSANNLLNNYLIGSVGSSVPVTQPTPTNPPVNNNPNPTAVPANPTTPPVQPTPTPLPANLVLNAAEVARHNSLSNCWLIISNVVYDVTRYITQHPGGASAITNMCGRESTSAFQTRGGSGSHSANANNLLANYRIGNFNSSVPVVPTNTPVPTTAPGQPTNTPVPGVPTNTPVPASGSNLPAAILAKYPGATRQSGGYEDNNSWEGKINTSSGSCRSIKVSSSGSITEDKSC